MKAGQPETCEQGIVDQVEDCNLEPGQGCSGQDGPVFGVIQKISKVKLRDYNNIFFNKNDS